MAYPQLGGILEKFIANQKKLVFNPTTIEINMKVFTLKYLETPVSDKPESADWQWQPANEEFADIYASGAPTNTQQSTYAAESDNRSDSDRPNEGMLLAA